ncbi:MAG TPA: iron dependent repressor, metal binding and dimerization domain protein [Bacillota bacterium]|jgi:Mn-dependent DtxR family transcriptional regulator|nr:iron dependent repressor, metal binding and dimerization domain protein [Bacillota bacterium]HOO31470.1 iron dependent repressor, metal binding and dimerization domain protein [Bacillota bacterium]HPQ03329.1 iron dependent repressor, metal binding and dimerization domain protein [Bacillota bacterium]
MLTPSLEDYLEELCRHLDCHGTVRPTDIALKLGVSMPSVTRALRRLADMGMIAYRSRSDLLLTEEGRIAGDYLVRRNHALCKFLRAIGCDVCIEDQAEAMEHYLMPETIDRIELLTQFLQDNENKTRFRDFCNGASNIVST